MKRFNHNQYVEDSIAMHIAEVCRLAAQCSFPCDHLDDALRDSFVCCLRSENMQIQLLAEQELTVASALEKAQNLEAVHCNVQVLKGHTPTLTVRKVAGHKFFEGHTCTKTQGHRSLQTPRMKDVECHNCEKRGVQYFITEILIYTI